MYFGRDDRLRWRGTWGQPVIRFLARFILCWPYETKLASRNPARHFPVTAEAVIFWGADRPFDPTAEAWHTCISCLLNRILDDLKAIANDRYDSLVELLKHVDDYIRFHDSKNGSNAFFSVTRSI
ncbi:hypothetical protein PFICI_09894 [Pestalotiopsis fici W106-1]|uniref:Uncharacterized protein n=1 Tax=Pestalotiopsis fici (strain W106-1 / CGMCC3.15140) TaxID=1229662 RepID=W3WXI7_PESFW|nr:uncharacterized protein PFICI_09894 [Pestalotiopsis fici W106-1]ETS77832.1 hypothetical protein PFICI_09894 [Pestalotiopsis fici W106-1]